MTLFDQWGSQGGSGDEETEESYFISMTDIMVGLLFIFIIMLMAFALMLKNEQEQTRATRQDIESTVEAIRDKVEDLRDLEQQRTDMLTDIQDRLRDQGIEVQLEEGSGVLRLPEELLFDRDADELDAAGQQALRYLAEALDAILPCYARGPAEPSYTSSCPDRGERDLSLQGVFIEGHTDSTGGDRYNWGLSARRAIETFQQLQENSSTATELRNSEGEYLFSVAGYGPHRPAVPTDPVDGRRENRRIDLRFVMNLSYESVLEEVERDLNSVLEADN